MALVIILEPTVSRTHDGLIEAHAEGIGDAVRVQLLGPNLSVVLWLNRDEAKGLEDALRAAHADPAGRPIEPE